MTEFTLESQKTYNGRYMYLTCTQQTLPAENKSIIHWVLTVTGGTSNYYTTGPTTLCIDGQTVYYSPTVYYNAPKFPASKGSVSGQLEVSHSSDGTKTVECSLQTAIYNGVLQENRASWELDAIPQASTVLATDCFIGSTCVVLVDRKNSRYTHSIGFCAPNLEGYLCADGTLSQEPVMLSATSIPFILPMTLYNKIPNAKTLECTLCCDTYLEENKVGDTQSCRFIASCREEDCRPAVQCRVGDANPKTYALTGDASTVVRFFSRALCEIYPLGRRGATIVKKQVGNVLMTEDEIELDGVESGMFVFTVTDSRGYRGQCSEELPLVPYKKLTANCAVRRQSPTSDRVELTVSGICWQGNFGHVQNTLQAFCQVGQAQIPMTVAAEGDTYTATVTVDGLSYDSIHILSVHIEDALMAYDLPVTVKPGMPVFHWGQRNFVFHVPVVLSDGTPAISQKDLENRLIELGLMEESDL